MAVMVMLYTTVLSTKMRNADGRSGHGGGEAEGQWIIISIFNFPTGSREAISQTKFSAAFRGIVVGGGVKLLGKRGGYSWVGSHFSSPRLS